MRLVDKLKELKLKAEINKGVTSHNLNQKKYGIKIKNLEIKGKF